MMSVMSISIDVALVAVVGDESADMLLGRLAALPALLGDDADQGLVHVRSECLGVAADVEMRALLEPGVEVPGLLEHAMLDVDLARLVPRESDVHPPERPGLEPGLPFGLVEEVAAEV